MSALASFSTVGRLLSECISLSQRMIQIPCRSASGDLSKLHVQPPGWRSNVDDVSKPTDPESRDHWVLSADQGRTIVCYHPERPFPFEHTLPVPRQESMFNEGDSVLKVQLRKDWHESSQPYNKEGIKRKMSKLFHMEPRYFRPRHHTARLERYKVYPVERDGI